VERQEHRIKRVCQKLDARVERQFLKTKSICKRLARKADKSKIRRRATETKFLKAITRSYVFFFFIGAQKELRITRLNAP
jgi:hypothetical protein